MWAGLVMALVLLAWDQLKSQLLRLDLKYKLEIEYELLIFQFSANSGSGLAKKISNSLLMCI